MPLKEFSEIMQNYEKLGVSHRGCYRDLAPPERLMTELNK